MPGPADLQALAQEILDASIEALDTIPVLAPGLEGAPERAFISPGSPALEGCGQLVVYVPLLTSAPTTPGGLGAGRRYVTGMLNHVTFYILIDRCVIDTRKGDHMSKPTIPQDLTDTAAQTNADIWALWNHLFGVARSETLFSLCSEVFFDGARALPEEGGRAGWTLQLRVRLDGYESSPST